MRSKLELIGGIGVIENDFHNRKDLTPNVCAVYVEENYRCQRIAGKLLEYVCEDMRSFGVWKPYISLQATQASMSATDGSSCVWHRAMVR